MPARETEGGDYFFQFHFAFHYLPVFLGVVLVGLASVGLMVALTTGLIIHRRIFADFFTFRPRSGQRSWLDAHTTLTVLALPFHVMITYTGVAILAAFAMPWAVFANYASPQTFFAQVISLPQAPKPSGHAEPLAPVNAAVKNAQIIWKGDRAETIRIINPGDASAIIEIDRHASGLIASDPGLRLTFSGVTGALRHTSPGLSGAATASFAMFGLHEARFARPVLRWLLFLCGAVGTGMIATGLILWTEKRRRRLLDPNHGRWGFRLVETLNVAVIAGYPAAAAAYFWANRLLPLTITSRADAEVLCAFVCWGVLLGWSALRPKRKAWVEVLSVAALLFLVLPIVNAETASRGTLTNIMQGDELYLGFDVVSLALGLLFAAAAMFTGWRVSSYSPPARADQGHVSGLPILESAE